MRVPFVLLAALGVGLAVGGVGAFVFGGWVITAPLAANVGGVAVPSLTGSSFGWNASDYCFLGSVMAAIGSALATAGFICLRACPAGTYTPFQRGPSPSGFPVKQ